MSLRWAGECSLQDNLKAGGAGWRWGPERFLLVLAASSSRGQELGEGVLQIMHEDYSWQANCRFASGRARSGGADVRTSNASPGHSEKAQDPRAWKVLLAVHTVGRSITSPWSLFSAALHLGQCLLSLPCACASRWLWISVTVFRNNIFVCFFW